MTYLRAVCALLFITLFHAIGFAAGEAAQSFTLDGRLYADAAATTPLTDSDVKLVFQITNPAQSCVLYEETILHYDASVGNGYFTLQIGSAVGTPKRSSLDTGHTMAQVFSNTLTNVSGRTFGGSACSYSPASGDIRYIRMLVTPSSDGVTRTLSPNMALDSVPVAVVAERAESIQGLGPANLLQVDTSGSQVLSQTNLETIFSSSNYSALTALLNGSSTSYSKPAANGTTPLASISSPTSPAAGQIWYDSGAIKFYNGSSTQTLGVSGAGITSLAAGTGLNVGAGPGGTITSTGTLNIDVGTTAGKILQVDTGNKLPVIDGSQLTNLPAPTSGTIGGSGATIVGATGSFGSTSTGQLSLYDHATTNTNYITIKTPATATLTADYTLTLPAALPGSAGQVLTSDTSGQLSWSSPSTGSVTSVTSGGAPIVIGGTGSAPTVSVSVATTSASGVVTLGVSADTAAGKVVQANDTRLTDSRTPAGTASGDLSGTYPSPTVAAINGKAVTYTTITSGDFLKYNGTGWVNTALSSANLSNNSDLLKASNMPANCSAGSTLTFSSPTGTWACTAVSVTGSNFASQSANLVLAGPTTGSATPTFRALTASDLPASASYWSAATGGINYAGGKVGIGTTTPGAALDVSGALRLSSTTMDNYATPVGSSVPTKINVPLLDPGSYGQVMAMGVPSNAQSTSRVITLFDARATAHQPTLMVLSPNESEFLGFNFNGSNTVGSIGSSVDLSLTAGGSEAIRALASGNVGIGLNNPGTKLEVKSGTANTSGVKLTNLTSASPTSTGQAIGVDASGNIVTVSSGGGGTVTSVTSGGAPIVVGGTGAAPTVSVSAATTSANGVVTLAANNGTTSGTVVQADDSRLTNSRAPSGTASGDLSGSYPGPTVAAINGKAVTYTSLANGDFLKYNGTGWVNTALSSANLSNDSNLLKASNMPANCSAGSTLTFSSPTGTWICTTITGIDAGAITTGTIADARLPASATYWQSATGGINYAGGKVGIGTTTPGQALSVAGAIESTSGGFKFPDGTTQTTAAGTGTFVGARAIGVWQAGAGTFKYDFTSKVFDSGSYFNLTTDRYTPLAAGKYLVTFTTSSDSATDGYAVQAIINKNGTTALSTLNRVSVYSSTSTSANTIVDMNGTTDYLEFACYLDGSSNKCYGDVSIILMSSATTASGGTGTANYVPSWTNSTTLGNSPIAVNGSNVGIGTTTAGSALTVAGTVESTSGGVKYPDASTQTTSAFGPAFCAKITTGNSTSNTTWVKAPFDTVEFDTDSGYSTTNRRYTPPKAGYYKVSTSLSYSQVATAGFTNYYAIYKNGSQIRAVQKLHNYTGSFGDTLSIDSLIYLNGTTDFIETWYTTNNSNAESTTGGPYSWFCADWVRP